MTYLSKICLVSLICFYPLWAQAPGQPPETKTTKPVVTSPKGVTPTPAKEPPKAKPTNQVSEFEKALQKELNGNTQTETEKAKKERPSWAWEAIKTLFVLALLLIFFYFGYKLFMFKRSLPQKQSEVLRVLYEYSLMPGKFVQIVEVNNRLLFLGLSDAGVQLISEVTEKTQIDQIKMNCDKDNQKGKPDFLLELSKAARTKVDSWLNPNKSMQGTDAEDLGFEALRSRSKHKLNTLRDKKDLLKDQNLFGEDGV